MLDDLVEVLLSVVPLSSYTYYCTMKVKVMHAKALRIFFSLSFLKKRIRSDFRLVSISSDVNSSIVM